MSNKAQLHKSPPPRSWSGDEWWEEEAALKRVMTYLADGGDLLCTAASCTMLPLVLILPASAAAEYKQEGRAEIAVTSLP